MKNFFGRLRGKCEGKKDVPPVGEVRFGSLRRVTPISREWGIDRGRPIDRYYIEKFLSSNAEEIRGHVAEIGDDSYTRWFGGERVTRVDVINVMEGCPKTTIIADLADAPQIPSDTFDCIICTQTLQYIYEVRAAVQALHRILKPGGVLFVTLPGITQTYDRDWGDHWCWNFTSISAKRLFEEAFVPTNIQIELYGNTLAAIAFLHGLAVEELLTEELDYREPGYEVIIAVKAVKRF